MSLETPTKYFECPKCSALAEACGRVSASINNLPYYTGSVACFDLQPSPGSLRFPVLVLSNMHRIITDSQGNRVSTLSDIVPCPGKINLLGLLVR